MNDIMKILRAFAFVSLSLNALVYGLDILHMIASLTSFAALGEVFHFGILFTITGGLAAWAAPYVFKDFKQYQQRRAAQNQRRATAQGHQSQQQAEQLAQWRREAPIREQQIRANYDNKMNFVRYESLLITETDQIKERNELWNKEMYVNVTMSLRFALSRALTSMSTSEIEICRYLELLRNYDLITNDHFWQILAGLVYNGGNCQQQVSDYFISRGFKDKHSINSESDAVRYIINRWNCGSMESSKALFLRSFSTIEGQYPAHHIVREFRAKVLAGTNWLSERDLSSSIFSDAGTGALFLGAMDDGRRIWYGKEGSLVSIAPPGSGKTQCHVLPNLLSYQGPAVVLDVKGECYEKTAAWRKANIGPVFKFAPLDPKESARFNPLELISDDPDTLWEECRLMADLLVVPESSNDPYWVNRARDVVVGVIAWLVRVEGSRKPPGKRSMSSIVNVVNKVGWTGFLNDAKGAADFLPLMRLGNSLSDLPDRQLESVLDTARRHLAVWEGARVEKVTSVCDWKPSDLRDGSNSTVYICIPPNEIESYAPLLRVLFAQHLRELMRKLPPREQTPILFMLDELPRLGPMKPVEEALEVGRQYGIRLWMFAQSLGQFQKAYANADGMVGSCAVRIFMNPSAHDGTAKRLAEELGYVESIIDGSRHLMVEPTELAGPEYEDVQIVLASNTRPLKLRKIRAWNDQEFKKRLPRDVAAGS
jgi:type IV secretion system protein VirD4